jgi:hypothetical protein
MHYYWNEPFWKIEDSRNVPALPLLESTHPVAEVQHAIDTRERQKLSEESKQKATAHFQ